MHTNSGSQLFQECMFLCRVWCGQNSCSMVTSQLDTHKAKRLRTRGYGNMVNDILLWSFPKQHTATKTWSFYTHWLHQKPGLCSLLPREHVYVEQCKRRHCHAVLPQHTQSWASLASELETQHYIKKVRLYIFKDMHSAMPLRKYFVLYAVCVLCYLNIVHLYQWHHKVQRMESPEAKYLK